MSSSLNILRVIPFFEPASSFGGSVSQAAASSAELAGRGHRVSVLTSDLGIGAGLERDCWIERDGYRVFYAAARGSQTRPPYPAAISAAVMAAAMQEADLVCMNVGLTLLNRKVRQLAGDQGLPYVYNAEGALCPLRLKDKRLAKLAFLTLFERRIIREASALQAVTEKEKRDLLRQGAEAKKVHVIPNAVQPGGPPNPKARQALRDRLAIPEQAIVLLFFGRLTPAKGVDLLFEACQHLLRQRSDLHLVFVGPDEGSRPSLQARAEDGGLHGQVHFPGSVDAEERRVTLESADLFLLPSRSEGLPLAALEAAAAGLPLLLSPGCNLPQVAEHGAGLVLPLELESWSNAIADLLADPQNLRRCGENARRLVSEQFALSSIVDRLEDLYRNVARR
ncbi:MAG: glycosyltransferase [Planctomycetota bacterium]